MHIKINAKVEFKVKKEKRIDQYKVKKKAKKGILPPEKMIKKIVIQEKN